MKSEIRNSKFAFPQPRRRGALLIMALLVMTVLASLVLVYARSMRVELTASGNRLASAQAMAIALGAVEAVLTMGDNVPVEAAPVGEGQFWILRPSLDSEAHAYGPVDEAGKINLNVADVETLAKLPGMNYDLANAIVAWRGDALPDQAYYQSLSDPYEPKSEPFETVEELLLVRGITPWVLYGEDANRNGRLDASEDDGEASGPPDNADGILDHGLFHFVTVYSREPAQRGEQSSGPQVNVNTAGTSRLRIALAGIVEDEDERDTVAETIRTGRPYLTMIDLFYKSTLTIEQFATFEQRVTLGQRALPPGRVNVNAAPAAVFAALPGLEPADAEALVEQRRNLLEEGNNELLRSVVWVTQALEQEKALAIATMITTVGYQRSADIVALGPDGRSFERIRIVYDIMGERPRLLALHRLTHLGWPLAEELRTQRN